MKSVLVFIFLSLLSFPAVCSSDTIEVKYQFCASDSVTYFRWRRIVQPQKTIIKIYLDDSIPIPTEFCRTDIGKNYAVSFTFICDLNESELRGCCVFDGLPVEHIYIDASQERMRWSMTCDEAMGNADLVFRSRRANWHCLIISDKN